MVMVTMVDGKLADVGPREFPRAAPADPREQFQRTFTVALIARIGGATGLADNPVKLRGVDLFHGDPHAQSV